MACWVVPAIFAAVVEVKEGDDAVAGGAGVNDLTFVDGPQEVALAVGG